MEQTTIHMLHHTHWDREWYQPFAAMQIRLRDALRHVVDLVERGVIDCFYLDGQTSVLDDYRRIVIDEEYQRLCALIRAGKIEVGPWFVLADEFLCPAEVVIQNLRIGRSMAGELGSFCGMGYLPDTFGHIGSMPMVLRQFGIDKAIIWRGADPEHCEVNWASADGSAVKTLVLSTRDGYFQVGLKNPDYKEHLQRFIEFHRTKKKAGLLVYTDGADHTVCSADGMDRVRSFEAGSGVKVEQVTMERLCRLLDSCPVEETIEGELRDNRKIFVLSGTWSTRTYLKRMNQIIAARLVHELEFLCAWEQNASRSEALRAPVFARQSTAESTGRLLLSLAGPVQFSGLEYEDGGYLLRLYNPLMQPQQVPLHTGFEACVRPEDLAANPAGEEQQGTRTLLTVGGRQLASYRIRPI